MMMMRHRRSGEERMWTKDVCLWRSIRLLVAAARNKRMQFKALLGANHKTAFRGNKQTIWVFLCPFVDAVRPSSISTTTLLYVMPLYLGGFDLWRQARANGQRYMNLGRGNSDLWPKTIICPSKSEPTEIQGEHNYLISGLESIRLNARL